MRYAMKERGSKEGKNVLAVMGKQGVSPNIVTCTSLIDHLIPC